MKKTCRLELSFLALAALALLTMNITSNNGDTARADTSAEKTAPKPVEENMHEFMEYVFQPTYKRLKQSMAGEPADRNAWKAVKSDALILAEGGNLLLLRKTNLDPEVWKRHSVEVRELGGNLYRAAAKSDYTTARKNYTAMITKCNSCHTTYAGGEHQLKP